MMMCDSGAGSVPQSRAKINNPTGVTSPGLGRRGALGSLLKGMGAVVVGEAILTDLAEGAAVRAGLTGAGEVAEVAGAGAAAEGVAALRNGKVVLGEMERQVFGRSIHLP
jgi:hypothetical protein